MTSNYVIIGVVIACLLFISFVLGYRTSIDSLRAEFAECVAIMDDAAPPKTDDFSHHYSCLNRLKIWKP